MVGSHAERILAAKLREGLWDAVLASNVVSRDDIDSIRFQKLLLKGIERFSLEEKLTVEWYLDGEVVSVDTADRDRAGKQTELDRAHQFHLEEPPTLEKIKNFYEKELDEAFLESSNNGTFHFLRTYYKEHKDILYRELYLRNLDIDQTLCIILNRLEEEKEVDDEDIGRFNQKCRDLKRELLMYEEFAQIPLYVDVFESGGTTLLNHLTSHVYNQPLRIGRYATDDADYGVSVLHRSHR